MTAPNKLAIINVIEDFIELKKIFIKLCSYLDSGVEMRRISLSNVIPFTTLLKATDLKPARRWCWWRCVGCCSISAEKKCCVSDRLVGTCFKRTKDLAFISCRVWKHDY